MTQTTHTPGPWILEKGKAHDLIVDKDGTPIAEINTFIGPFGRDENNANAHLIAAAPELLRAIELIINSDMAQREEDEGNISTELSIARAAYAKATGE